MVNEEGDNVGIASTSCDMEGCIAILILLENKRGKVLEGFLYPVQLPILRCDIRRTPLKQGEKVIMQASSSSRRGDHQDATVMCPRCNIEGIRKVSQSSQNPGRMYAKCLRCEKFLGWVHEANPNLERRLLSEIEIVKHELRELKMILKIVEKGQSILAMLEIGVILVKKLKTKHLKYIKSKLAKYNTTTNISSLNKKLITKHLKYINFELKSLAGLSGTPVAAIQRLLNSSDPSDCHSLKSLSSLSSSYFLHQRLAPNSPPHHCQTHQPLLFVVGIINAHQNHASPLNQPLLSPNQSPPLVLKCQLGVQTNPVRICGKGPPLVFSTRRMPSKPRKLR
ncbi:hypothetical protein Cgig2_029663 [Carnegiea gigantea]|uniref:GRF-like zinc ribbon domain-containing protein n=1 Tax=Carnegiea gigantea TaxID=171969 RepID=A0A9Q1QIF5_9CARY|nr:hypothetical protein Cgig2_029663 [Carnegiea gigantea]